MILNLSSFYNNVPCSSVLFYLMAIINILYNALSFKTFFRMQRFVDWYRWKKGMLPKLLSYSTIIWVGECSFTIYFCVSSRTSLVANHFRCWLFGQMIIFSSIIFIWNIWNHRLRMENRNSLLQSWVCSP